MTELPAKLNRIGELVGFVAPHHAQPDEGNDETEYEGQHTTLAGVVKIDMEITYFLTGMLTLAAPVVPDPKDHQEESRKQKTRNDHVGQNADVRAGMLGGQIQEKQEQKVSERYRRHGEAQQGDGIA
jgi:hypothetical protein